MLVRASLSTWLRRRIGAVRRWVAPRLPATRLRDLHLVSPRPRQPGDQPRSSRLILESWSRSNRPNRRAGDVMELRWRDPQAKAFIGWWDATDPADPRIKAWIGAHDLANERQKPPHRHWSVEVTDSQGHMRSRLAVPYDRDHTRVEVSHADLVVTSGGALRVTSHGEGGGLEFCHDAHGGPSRRWKLRMARASEDLELLRERPGAEAEPVLRVRPDGEVEVTSLSARGGVWLRDERTGARVRLGVVDGELTLTPEAAPGDGEDHHEGNGEVDHEGDGEVDGGGGGRAGGST